MLSKNTKSAWNNLPQGIVALFFIQVFSTLSFSVLYSTLVLYMTGKLGLSVKLANSITGVFVAFNFALHLLGGYWGGRFLSNRALFSIGMLSQTIGCFLLAMGNEAYLYYGLAAFLTGCGLNVTCINCMLTQRFEPSDNRRESAFLWNYAGMNIGFFVGFSLSGYFQLSQNYQRLFLLSSLGNLIALFICLYCWQALADRNTRHTELPKQQQQRASLIGLVMVLCMPLVLSQLLHFADLAKKLVLVVGVLMIIAAYRLALKQETNAARQKIQAFIVLLMVGTIFWMLFQIGPMGLTHFIDQNVERNWYGITIPPQWFQNINTVCIVIGGPLMSLLLNYLRRHKVQVNIPTQFALALLCIGLAFAILPLGIARANEIGLVGPEWVVLSFVLQSIGELLISPIGYAMIGALAPTSALQGIMMGMWMLTSGVGATLSSYSSNWMATEGVAASNPLLTNGGYSYVFLRLGLLAIAASVLLFILVPCLKKWMSNNPSPKVEPNLMTT